MFRVLVVRLTLLQCLHHKVHSRILLLRSRYREKSKHVLHVANKRYDLNKVETLLDVLKWIAYILIRSNVLWTTTTGNRHVDGV